MADLLDFAGDLPEVELAPGEILLEEGTRTGSIWVLVSGSLQVLKGDVLINTIGRPGAAFGEVAVLLEGNHSATVRAAAPTRLRYARDGRAFLTSAPDLLFLLASGLAERLDVITGYLADLRTQYATAPGIAMVGDVLGRLTQPSAPIRAGSAREPDPEY